MVTDVILSGLTNLFALFGASRDVDAEVSKQTIGNYFGRHFGIRNISVYLDLYEELRDLYGMSEEIDKGMIVEQVCTNISKQLQAEEQALILLRLMEFCTADGSAFDADDIVLRTASSHFGISEEIYSDFCSFVKEEQSGHVTIQRYDGMDGQVKVLWLAAFNKLLFAYNGNDEVLMDDVPVLNGVYQVWAESGVLKVQKTGARVYYSDAHKAYSKWNASQQIEFCGRNINFRFPGSQNGIHTFDFTLRSGELVAIMGGSGAGKSTLQSLLNGSLIPQEGTITVNGHDVNDPMVKSLIGYVPQDDLLIEELTVYQNLWFTARLSFEGMSNEELDKRVRSVLHELGLEAAMHLKVGSAINKYISGGQRKRLNIALELIREPAVLFLDEPTSGLSSADTEKVVNILKQLTHKGKLIITNIHQPSSDVYKLFDRLWLLDRGGYPVFDGNPIEAITYFKTSANYADAESSTCPTCGNVNPEVVLNIIDEKSLTESGELSDVRKVQPEEWHQMYLASRSAQPELTVADVPETSQRKPSALKQLGIFLHRNIRTKITNLQYLLITLLEAPLLALICGLLTRYAPPEGYSVMENKNLVSYIFMAVIVATFIGMSGSAEEIIKDRALLKREKFLHLSHASYIWSKIIFMAVVTAFQTLLFVQVGNAVMGLSGLTMVWWGALFLAAFVAGLTGLLLSQTLSSVVAIYITIPLLLIPQILLCGLVVDFTDLTPGSKTGNVPLIGNVIPSRWAYEALAVTQFTDNEYRSINFQEAQLKYEAQYYHSAFLYEMQSQLETMRDEEQRGKDVKPEHIEVIRKALPVLADVTGQNEYAGDYGYASLRKYMDEADAVLADRLNRATLAEDSKVSLFIRQHSKDELLDLKRRTYNLQLENFVLNADARRTHEIVDNTIVARAGQIYLTPRTHCGNAPFYSHIKIVGSKVFKTLHFNSMVLAFMSVILTLLLLIDIPGRRRD